MVRGGPANRAVKRAKIFALTKVSLVSAQRTSPRFPRYHSLKYMQHTTWLFLTSRTHVHPPILTLSLGFSWPGQELLQHSSEGSTQSSTTCLPRTQTQEERHETGALWYNSTLQISADPFLWISGLHGCYLIWNMKGWEISHNNHVKIISEKCL